PHPEPDSAPYPYSGHKCESPRPYCDQQQAVHSWTPLHTMRCFLWPPDVPHPSQCQYRIPVQWHPAELSYGYEITFATTNIQQLMGSGWNEFVQCSHQWQKESRRKKLASCLQLLFCITRLTGVFVVRRQQMKIAFARAIKLMAMTAV